MSTMRAPSFRIPWKRAPYMKSSVTASAFEFPSSRSFRASRDTLFASDLVFTIADFCRETSQVVPTDGAKLLK
jgi:hypothetical protein